MRVVNETHLKRTIEFLLEKAEDMAAEAEKLDKDGLEHLAGWFEGRGKGFAMAAAWIEADIQCWGDEA